MRKSAATNCLSAIDCRLDSRYQVQMQGHAHSLLQSDDMDDVVVTLGNISIGGFQTTRRKLLEGQQLIVDLPGLGERLVQVRWVKGPRAGCKFIKTLTRNELQAVASSGEA